MKASTLLFLILFVSLKSLSQCTYDYTDNYGGQNCDGTGDVFQATVEAIDDTTLRFTNYFGIAPPNEYIDARVYCENDSISIPYTWITGPLYVSGYGYLQGEMITLYMHAFFTMPEIPEYDVCYLYDPALNVETLPAPAHLEIYPNPVQDILKVALDDAAQIPSYFEICDVTGKVAMTFPTTSHLSTYTFNVSELCSGVYLFRYTDANDRKHCTQIVIE